MQNPQNCQTHSNNSSATADNCLRVFDHFVRLALKGLSQIPISEESISQSSFEGQLPDIVVRNIFLPHSPTECFITCQRSNGGSLVSCFNPFVPNAIFL